MSRPRRAGPATQWIVCRGEQRDVRNDSIACPLRGTATALEICLECRYLAWVADERDRPDPCGLDELS